MKCNIVREIAQKLIFAICFNVILQATESSSLPTYYPEFKASMGIINKLHELVNETDIDVKSASSKRNGSLLLECYPDWNTTDQGLVAYFEEEHLTKVYTPFGSLMIFWLTRADKKWNPVLEKLKKTCALQEQSFSTKYYDVKDSHPILSVNNVPLKQPTRIMQGDQKRKVILASCIAHYLQEDGTLTELKSLGKRKKTLEEKKQAHKSQHEFLERLTEMFDL